MQMYACRTASVKNLKIRKNLPQNIRGCTDVFTVYIKRGLTGSPWPGRWATWRQVQDTCRTVSWRAGCGSGLACTDVHSPEPTSWVPEWWRSPRDGLGMSRVDIRDMPSTSYPTQTTHSLNAADSHHICAFHRAAIPRRRHRYRHGHPREDPHRHVRHARFPEVIPVASWTTRRHSHDDPREDVGKDVGDGVRVGVVECQLYCIAQQPFV